MSALCESGWTGDRCALPLFHDGAHDNETTCDECGHPSDAHLNAHDATTDDDRSFLFANATCWAENVCEACLSDES